MTFTDIADKLESLSLISSTGLAGKLSDADKNDKRLIDKSMLPKAVAATTEPIINNRNNSTMKPLLSGAQSAPMPINIMRIIYDSYAPNKHSHHDFRYVKMLYVEAQVEVIF